mmetsp:Transcript_56040/g.99784  ORF Transcript_56040/g.99784 Transcript_56040/m.99784 type:complete len:272 (+) Transcript_56040:353-1168(+)
MIPSQLEASIPQDPGEAVRLRGIESSGMRILRILAQCCFQLVRLQGSKEKIAEAVFRLVHPPEEGHSQMLGVEFNRRRSILDSHHCLGKVVILWPPQLLPSHNLNPVSIRIKSKGQSLHAAFVGLLLELHSSCLKPCASLVDIVTVEGNMTEPPESWFLSVVQPITIHAGVAIPYLITVIHLGAMVVSELEGCIGHGEQVALILQAGFLHCAGWHLLTLTWTLQEVDSEFPLWEVNPMDQLHSKIILIEWHRDFRVFHSQHRLLEACMVRT